MARPEIDRLDLLVVLDLAWRPLPEDATVVHDRDIGRHSERDVEIVLDDDVADVRRESVEDCDEVTALGWRQSGCRLIEEDKARGAG